MKFNNVLFSSLVVEVKDDKDMNFVRMKMELLGL